MLKLRYIRSCITLGLQQLSKTIHARGSRGTKYGLNSDLFFCINVFINVSDIIYYFLFCKFYCSTGCSCCMPTGDKQRNRGVSQLPVSLSACMGLNTWARACIPPKRPVTITYTMVLLFRWSYYSAETPVFCTSAGR